MVVQRYELIVDGFCLHTLFKACRTLVVHYLDDWIDATRHEILDDGGISPNELIVAPIFRHLVRTVL